MATQTIGRAIPQCHMASRSCTFNRKRFKFRAQAVPKNGIDGRQYPQTLRRPLQPSQVTLHRAVDLEKKIRARYGGQAHPEQTNEEHSISLRKAFEDVVLGMGMVVPPVFPGKTDDAFFRQSVVDCSK